jgi:hypothetical protein
VDQGKLIESSGKRNTVQFGINTSTAAAAATATTTTTTTTTRITGEKKPAHKEGMHSLLVIK